VRRRLVIAIALVAAGAVILFATPLLFAVRNHLRDQELLRLERDAVAATRQIDLPTGRGDQVELPDSGDQLAVYDLAGRRIAGTGPARADTVVREAVASGRPADEASAGRLVASVPLVVHERVTGVLRASRPDAALARRVRNAWLGFAALAALVLAGAVIAALALARWLARPLERLAVTARRLGEGDFTARSPASGVAEVDQLGEVLAATGARLETMLARERTFSADASHQLRTPLAALRIELEAMALGGRPPAELDAALAQVERLQETIDTLLAAARDVPRDARATPVREVLDGVRERWRAPLTAAGRALRVDPPGGDLVADVSPTVAAEVLSVLVDNACRHGAGTVTVRARRAPGGSVAIEVEDEGAGPADPAEAIFRRRDGNGVERHGIGLALARSLAEAEGGRLSLSRPAPPVFTLLVPEAGQAPARQ